MHTGRNSSSILALSTQSCPLKLGKNFSPAHKFPNFVSGHTGSFGCTTSRKADNPKCVTLTSIHFAPCQVRFNINQSQYIIKAKLKVSSKFGKKRICMKLKATLIHLRTGVATAFGTQLLPWTKAPGSKPCYFTLYPFQVLFSPSPFPFRSDLAPSFFSVQMLLTHPQILHLLWQEGFGKERIAEWGLFHWDFPPLLWLHLLQPLSQSGLSFPTQTPIKTLRVPNVTPDAHRPLKWWALGSSWLCTRTKHRILDAL